MKLNKNSVIKLKHIKQSLKPDKDGQYVVVVWDTDQSLKVSGDVIDILKELAKDNKAGKVASVIGVSISDLQSLITDLSESGFIESVDGKKIKDNYPKIKPMLTYAPRWIFRLFLSRLVLIVGFLIIISGLYVGITQLHYIPRITHYFWHPDIFIVYITGFAAEAILLAVHEAAHFIATKALGGEATMRLSLRSVNIVAETESFHLAVIPKELRYYVYFAGMYVDFLLSGSIFWVIYLLKNKMNIDIGIYETWGYSLLIIFITGIVWQYNVYLKTDMYNFLSDLFDEEHLQANTRKYLGRFVSQFPDMPFKPIKNLLKKIIINKETEYEAEDLRQYSKKEKKLIFLYGILFITGMVGLIATFALIDIPKKIIAVYKTIMSITSSIASGNLFIVVRQMLLLLLMVYQYIIFAILSRKGKEQDI